jgi:plastocyanin
MRSFALAVAVSLLAASGCGPRSTPQDTQLGIASAATPSGTEAATPVPILAPTPTAAVASRCVVTSGGVAAATIHVTQDSVGFFDYDGPVTITAGQSVTFVNGNAVAHTITEGIDGVKAEDACVDALLGTGASVAVTFRQPGTYQFTCRPHPVMQTTVIVK